MGSSSSARNWVGVFVRVGVQDVLISLLAVLFSEGHIPTNYDDDDDDDEPVW